MNSELYIGYEKKAPPRVRKLAKLVIIALLLLMPVGAFLITSGQKGFASSTFEFGKLTQLEGFFYKDPYPMLRIKGERDSYGNPIYITLPLVNIGKMGIQQVIGEIEAEGVVIDEHAVKIEGTLIYYDGKALLELSNQGASVLEVFESVDETPPHVLNLGEIELTGEIIDPKCYFGVMKPGENKPHRSCAVRCISGGIPPVLMTTDSIGRRNYFMMASQTGEPINKKVLPYVAEQVRISGSLVIVDDWVWIFTSPDITRLSH